MVIYKDLPYKVKGFTMYHAVDDYYTIVLNSRLSSIVLKKVFKHELMHIEKNHFHSQESVAEIEFSTHCFA